jgi:DNA topoisomerase 2-associated protein PAT1
MVPLEEVPDNVPHPLVAGLNYPKGLKAAHRALSLLDIQPSLGFFSLLFKRIECLDITNTQLGKEREKVESFMTNIFPSLTNILSESTIPILNALMQIILERHELKWLIKSRVGLVVLTMMLSRAELLKQQNTSTPDQTPISEDDLSMWEEVYGFIFNTFQGDFPSLFLDGIDPEDEVYIWQFLAAMAVGASGIDHQRILVQELR